MINKKGSSNRLGQNDEYQSQQQQQQKIMYSSHESNLILSDQNSGSLAPQSRVVQSTKESQRLDTGKLGNQRGKSSGIIVKETSSAYNTQAGLAGMNGRQGVTSQENYRGNRIQKAAYDKKKDWQAFPVKVQNLNQMVQIRKKKPKMKFVDKQAFKQQQERQIYSQQVQHRNDPKRFQKILDGFLLLYSCRVKLPHEAIRSKLSGENIVDVREEDLVYFKQNLKYLDVSDNSIFMEQLVNLQNLEELDMQYNNLDHLELQPQCFPQLQILHLSYNKIPPSHLLELQYLQKLKVLDIASNDFCTLPSDLSFFKTLEEINLSSNNFSTDSVLVNPNKLFSAMATIPNLKKLNLSRNKFKAFHSEDLPQENIQLDSSTQQQVFPHLIELNFAFNLVDSEENLMYCVQQLPSLQILVVTGNPFAIKGDPFETANLENILNMKGGKLINETLQPPTYLRRQGKSRVGSKPPLMLNYNFPQSREIMVIQDNIPSKVFHKEQEDLFPMPPKEQQIEAIEYQQDQTDEEQQDNQQEKNENRFFITEDEMLRDAKNKPQSKQSKAYQKLQDPIIQEENYDPNLNPQQVQRSELSYDNQQQQQTFDEDYGRLKMERFKQQCRDILGKGSKSQRKNSNIYAREFQEQDEDEEDQDTSQYVKARDYSNFLDIISAYKNLKQAVNKPSTVHDPSNIVGSKGYLKMTIAATQHSKSKMARDLLEYSLATKQERVAQTAVGGARGILTLAGQYQPPIPQPNNFLQDQKPPHIPKRGPSWRKSKQEVIDEKVERLFESYKIMDEVQRKQSAIEGVKEEEKKKNGGFRSKYFPDEDDD